MQKRLQSSNGEPAHHWDVRFIGKVGRTHRNSALNAWVQPHQTDTTETLFHRDTNQREAEAIERMGRIDHLNCVGRECG